MANNKRLVNFMNFFDDDDDGWFTGFARPSKALKRMEKQMEKWQPRCDIAENKDSFTVHAELPGIKKEDIQVHFDHDSHVLSIKGETKSETKVDHEKYHKVERRAGSFERQFVLPQNADGDKVVATLKEGVLEISIPKLAIEEKPKVKSIQVQ